MARVTVEDCVDKVPNRFELVMLAAHRAREIAAGSALTVDRDNDKNPVVALREIVTASSHTAHSITRISQVSHEMSGLSAQLDALVRQFKLVDPA